MVSVDVETIVTAAEPEALGSAMEVARMCIVAGDGTEDGAVYNPVPDIVPQAAPVHPEILQETDVSVVPVTVAENCCCPPVET
jgi:hypothetical protein